MLRKMIILCCMVLFGGGVVFYNSTDNYVVIEGVQNAEDVLFEAYKKARLGTSSNKNEKKPKLRTVKWTSFSLQGARDGGLSDGNPLSSLGVHVNKDKLLGWPWSYGSDYVAEFDYADKKYGSFFSLREGRDSGPIPLDSKFTLVGKVIEEEGQFELVEIISFSLQEKTKKEEICKRGILKFYEIELGDEVYVSKNSLFVNKKKNENYYNHIDPYNLKIDFNVSYQTLDITKGELVSRGDVKTEEFIKILDELWVKKDDVIPAKIESCDLIDQVAIQQTKVKLKNNVEVEFNGKAIFPDHPHFKDGIYCIKDRIGVVNCGDYFFSDSDFIKNFASYKETVGKVTANQKSNLSFSGLTEKAQGYISSANNDIGLALLKKDCDLDLAESCYNAGVFLSQDYLLQEEGLKYYIKACDLNIPEACYNIGGIQLKGDLASRFDALAKFKKACAMGLKHSCLVSSRLEKVFDEKKGGMGYEALFEILFPETVQQLKQKGQYKGIYDGARI